MIEKVVADGTLLRIQPEHDGVGPRLRLVFDDDAAEGGRLEPVEAAEAAIAMLRWVADAVRHTESPTLHVAIGSSIDRTSRLLGVALERDGAS